MIDENDPQKFFGILELTRHFKEHVRNEEEEQVSILIKLYEQLVGWEVLFAAFV